jgi:putative ABC transport system permease protein
MFNRLPTAWLQLKAEKIRLLIAIAGISFAVILIFMQLGLRNALFESSVRLHNNLQGDVFLINPRSNALVAMESFTERRLGQVLAFDEVEFVCPIYVDFAQWKNPDTKKTRNIFVIGFDVRYSVFSLPGVKNNLDKLRFPDTLLFDVASRPEFGKISQKFEEGKTIYTELRRRNVKVAGLFQMGASFGADGNLITSDLNFLRIFTSRRKGLIDIGVIKLQQGKNVEDLVKKIRNLLPKDVKVLSKQDFINFEKTYWQTSTAIGFIFDLGVIIGLIVGIVIVYQILYTDVSNHLAEYATLKAIGYTQTYLLSVVFQESCIIAVLGYIPGLFLSLALYKLTRNATLLPIAMELTRGLFVLKLTFMMCFTAGFFAMRKLKYADPADIF